MNADGSPERGYDPDVDGEADPHDSRVGVGANKRTWNRLGHELTNATDVRDLVGTIQRYGWAAPLLGLLASGIVRGVFEHLAEPYAMSQEYVFPGWQFALGINVLYGFFLTAFSWFLYFGVIGGFAGYFSDETKMETTIFKVGGYLMVLFVPLVAVAAALVLTIPTPETAIAGVDSTAAVQETYRTIANTPQMRLIDTIMAGGWIVVGFLTLPVVSDLYEIERKYSVVSVLPVTLIAVVGTVLV